MSEAAGWYPVPVDLVDEVMPHLRDTELRVLLVVLRQTAGWRSARQSGDGRHKRRDWLSHSQLCLRTGRGSDAVSSAVASLVSSGLLIVEDSSGNALATPEERRRHLGRLYFRPGKDGPAGRLVEMWKTGGASRPGKPGTTTHWL